jgi:hypothetical protein
MALQLLPLHCNDHQQHHRSTTSITTTTTTSISIASTTQQSTLQPFRFFLKPWFVAVLGLAATPSLRVLLFLVVLLFALVLFHPHSPSPSSPSTRAIIFRQAQYKAVPQLGLTQLCTRTHPTHNPLPGLAQLVPLAGRWLLGQHTLSCLAKHPQ